MTAPRPIALASALLLSPLGASAAAPANNAELGSAIYTNCAGCHGDHGQGGFAPPFAGNSDLKDSRAMIAHVVTGSANMPPFGGQLAAAQIAAVLNHVRNSWGNKAPPVGAAEVTAVEKPLAAAPERK